MKEMTETGAASDRVKIAKRLRDFRVKRNVTQAALAKQAGVSRSAIVNYENAKAVPGGIELIKLAQALKTTPNYVLSGSEEFRSSENMEHFLAAGSVEEQVARLSVLLRVLEPPIRNAISALVVESVRERATTEEFEELMREVDQVVRHVVDNFGEFEPTFDRISRGVDAASGGQTKGDGAGNET